MPPHPVLAAVTGIGCVCAAGITLDAVLARLDKGPPEPALPTRFAGLEQVHPIFEVSPLPARMPRDNLFLDTGLGFLLEGTYQALETAGLSQKELAGKRVGVCIGSSVGFAVNYFPLYKAWKQDEVGPTGLLETFRRSNYALALKEYFGFAGPCQLVANACASGTDAIGIAAGWIASGLCDMVLAGGAESLSFISYYGFSRLMIADAEPCKPFDRNRGGLNLGEGAGVMLLEPAGTRRTALGLVLGYGAAGDAHHPTAPHMEGRGLRRAIKTAMLQAGVRASDLAFISTHGTATKDNDKVEGTVLADMLPGVPLLATKRATGHALGAAGAIEAAITLGCLNRGILPASPGFREPDPETRVVPTTRPLMLESRIAVSDSLAFGGCNAALVLQGGAP